MMTNLNVELGRRRELCNIRLGGAGGIEEGLGEAKGIQRVGQRWCGEFVGSKINATLERRYQR